LTLLLLKANIFGSEVVFVEEIESEVNAAGEKKSSIKAFDIRTLLIKCVFRWFVGTKLYDNR